MTVLPARHWVCVKCDRTYESPIAIYECRCHNHKGRTVAMRAVDDEEGDDSE